eukprot:403335781
MAQALSQKSHKQESNNPYNESTGNERQQSIRKITEHNLEKQKVSEEKELQNSSFTDGLDLVSLKPEVIKFDEERAKRKNRQVSRRNYKFRKQLKTGYLSLLTDPRKQQLQEDNQFENQRYQSKSFKYERNDQTPPGGYFSSNNISTQPSQPMDNYLISKQVIDSPIQYKTQHDKEPSFVQESSLNNSTDDEKYFKNMRTSVQVQAKKAVTQIQQKVKEYLNELRGDICRFMETLMADQGILMDDILHFTEMQEIQCFIENPIKLKNQEVDQFSFESIIRIGVKKLVTLKERFLQNESINNAQTTNMQNKGQVSKDNLSGFNSINNSKRGVDQKRVSFDNEEKEQLNQSKNQYENRPKDYVSKSQMSKYSPNQTNINKPSMKHSTLINLEFLKIQIKLQEFLKELCLKILNKNISRT